MTAAETGVRVRWGLLVVGATLAFLGLASLASPAVTALVGTPFRLLENQYFVVAAVGIISIVAAGAVLLTWALADSQDRFDQESIPERPIAVPVPGDELDTAVVELIGEKGRAVRPTDHREHIRERLRQDAIETLRRRQQRDLATAREMVATGTWTANRFAASFLGGPQAPDPTVVDAVRRRIARRDPFEHRVYASIDAIEAISVDREADR